MVYDQWATAQMVAFVRLIIHTGVYTIACLANMFVTNNAPSTYYGVAYNRPFANTAALDPDRSRRHVEKIRHVGLH